MVALKEMVKSVLPREYLATMLETLGSVRSVLYAGNQVSCPCCGGEFRQFLPAGVDRRPNATCPRCNSRERHRLLWLYLKTKTNLFTDQLRVLHIAPEYMFQKAFKAMPNLDYLSAGLVAPLADEKMDITDIAYADNSFDVILCNHVLEHIPDDRKAMRELHRVLKPGGWAVLQVPLDPHRLQTFEDWTITSPQDRERFFGLADHVRVYGLDYQDRLEECGFTVKVEPFVRDLGPEIAARYALPGKEDIYFCTKSVVSLSK